MKTLAAFAALSLVLVTGCMDDHITGPQISAGCPYGDLAYCDDWPDNGVWDPPDTTTTPTNVPFPVLTGALWADSLWVVVGQKIITSRDGSTFEIMAWNDCNLTANWLMNPIRKSGRFIAYRQPDRIFVSDSLPIWNEERMEFAIDSLLLFQIAASEAGFVAIGYAPSTGMIMLQSSDGISWESCPRIPDVRPQNVIWDGQRFVASADSIVATVDSTGIARYEAKQGIILTSPDGVIWESHQTDRVHGIFLLTKGKDLYAGVSHNDSLLQYEAVTSRDLISWTPVTGVGRNMTALATDGTSVVVALGSWEGILHISGRGTETRGNIPYMHYVRSIVYGNGQFVALGDGVIATSPNGLSWTVRWKSEISSN